ncbi:MAG: purine/pyrimidine permease, partial [Alphaproteobacteria bacterium]|nr:purine/pyrimidine permease [Alphaproteobacteria bacterium]
TGIRILSQVDFAKGFVANIAVLLGIVVGIVVAIALGHMNFDRVASAGWVGLVLPFSFGMPTFDFWSIVTMCVVMIVVMIESTGMFLALGDLVGKPVKTADLNRGLRVDGLGSMLGGIFNTFPYTSFSQNVGLVGVTGIASRFVCVAGGIMLLLMGLVPKLAAIIAAIPDYVLGGAGLVMFGMVAATGIRILSQVDFAKGRNNLFIIALAVGFGMIPLIAPNFKLWMPHAIYPLIESGILLAAVVAVLLNLLFNGLSADSVKKSVAAAKLADH